MKDISIKYKRIFLFIFGCVLSRLSLMFLVKHIDKSYLPILGFIALFPAIGFSYIYLNDLRKRGAEVFGQEIWWNDLRPFHSLMYFLLAIFAITKNTEYAWKTLLFDLLVGFLAFLSHHTLA